MRIVMISGGFDPLHEGHVQLIAGAAQYGDVVVALNSDAWLLRKKGYVFQPWAARAIILRALRHVASVVRVNDEDGTVAEAILRLKPDLFANGGDRESSDPGEHEACLNSGTREIFYIGGVKVQSSSQLVNNVKRGVGGS